MPTCMMRLAAKEANMTSKVVSMEEYKKNKGQGGTTVNRDQMPLHPLYATPSEAAEYARVHGDPAYHQFFFNDLPIPEDDFPPPRA